MLPWALKAEVRRTTCNLNSGRIRPSRGTQTCIQHKALHSGRDGFYKPKGWGRETGPPTQAPAHGGAAKPPRPSLGRLLAEDKIENQPKKARQADPYTRTAKELTETRYTSTDICADCQLLYGLGPKLRTARYRICGPRRKLQPDGSTLHGTTPTKVSTPRENPCLGFKSAH